MTVPPVCSPAFYEALVASSHDVIVTEAMDGTITSYNPAAERMYNRRAADAIGRPIAEVHPTSQSTPILEARMAARRGEEVPAIELTRAIGNGLIHVSVRFSPIVSERGEIVGITSIVRDISHRAAGQAELELRASQQAAVAWFGQRAMESASIESLMPAAVDLVSRTIGVDYVKLLTVSADRTALVLSAGTGWRPELYGTAVEDLSRNSPAGLALLGGVPIIVSDLTSEPLFSAPSFLHDHGIASGISVVIRGPDEPFGVLGAYSATVRSFSVDDLHFLEAVTNILGTALSRFKDLMLLEQRVTELARLSAIIASSNDAIMSETLDGTILSWNPAAAQLYGIPIADAVGMPIASIIPSARSPVLLEYINRVRRGEEVAAFEPTRLSADGTIREVSIKLSPVRDDTGKVDGVSAIVRDISERIRIQRELQEQRRMLSTLLGNLPGMAYRCRNEPDWPMEFVSNGCLELTGYSAETIVSGPEGYAGLIHPDDRGAVWARVQAGVETGQPFRMTYRIVTAGGEEKWVSEQGCGVTSPTGELEALEGFISDVTDRVLAYQSLENRVAERTRELRVLLDISHDTAATLELGPLVGLILDRIKGVVDYTGAALYVLDETCEALTLVRYQGPIPQHRLNYRWTLESHDHARATIETGRPVIIGDVFGDHPLAESLRRNAIRDLGEVRADFGSWMSVPMKLGDRVTGMLAVEIDQIDCYTDHHAELLMAVADQAAVAVENARLYEQARGLAALEERQKLARELHDSVSQALFGIGLGARTARALLDRDPARVEEPLDYVIGLAEAGLTEMRALIFELRPEALELEGLVGSLEKQLAALQTRHGLTIDADLDQEPDVPFDVKETLYRIAQETLNNVAKHAQARTVTVRLATGESGTRLEITDDGTGFDPSGSFPGHLGLRSMRERAARIGAALELESAIGRGTSIVVLVPPAS